MLIITSPLLAAFLACESNSGLKYYDMDSGSNEEPALDGAEDDDDGGYQPPETEENPLLYRPAVTDSYLFVVNPARDTVSRVNVESLAVDTVAVGNEPTTIETTLDGKRAITLNEGDDSASIVDASTLAVTTVPLRDGMNRLSLSETGRWAMTWYDESWPSSGSWAGVVSFNEVSFVGVDDAVHAPLVVGYRPHGVEWSADGRRAVVVSDDLLAVVDLTAETPVATLFSLSDYDDPPAAEEVVLSPDGEYAIVRQFGAEGLLAVNLDSGERITLPMLGTPTDMDVDPTGTRLAVLVRDRQEIYEFDLASPLADPLLTVLDTQADYGSLAYCGDDGLAVLYTNASATARLGVWNASNGTVTEKTLVKPVETVGAVTGRATGVVFHTRSDQAGIDDDSPFKGEWALSLLDLESMIATPFLLSAETEAWGSTDDGAFTFVGLKEAPLLEVFDVATHLPYEVALPSAPTNVGSLPGRPVGYASMEHDLGRIGFYDAETGDLDTLTGFELNAEIDH